jgi:ribosomal protein S12 methylthiotransferase accessory factor
MINRIFETKAKDSDPISTVNHIRGILGKLGILTKERWTEDVKGFYSVNIRIVDTNIFANGKGTTCAFALASAYGEMMERLQNFAFVGRRISRRAFEYGGFCYAPDEKNRKISGILSTDELWMGDYIPHASLKQERKDVLGIWHDIDEFGGCNGFLSVPYRNIINGDIYYIPEIMIKTMHGSNGMCAGNTKEEALLQGISELIERLVQSIIMFDNITPPTIPESYIKEKYPNIYNLISSLKSKGNFEIIVKDCSLGKGFPVAGIIFLDKSLHSYYVRFGAHPVFEIAVERSLTELMQGRNLKDREKWLSRFSYINKEESDFKNLWDIGINGVGYYPQSLFYEEYSYEFTQAKELKSYDNKEMLSYLINLLHKNKYEVLIRDVSFLGFPAFHVIASTFNNWDKLHLHFLENIPKRDKMAKTLMNLGNVNDTELEQAVDYMYNEGINSDESIVSIIHQFFKSNFSWNAIKRDLFIFMASYKTKDYKKAYEAIDRFVNSSNQNISRANLDYYRCIRDYVGALSDEVKNEKEIAQIIGKFYPVDLLSKVISELRKPDEVFKNCAKLDCFNCVKCEYKSSCTYPMFEEIYFKIKKEYLQNPIDQKDLAYQTLR